MKPAGFGSRSEELGSSAEGEPVPPPGTFADEPLVSIGIPTYERASVLGRALASARAQTHVKLEIVISDNGSRDGTEALCAAAAAEDPRIRYLREERNLGPTANFNRLFEVCRGEFVMMLADDDWLDPEYVSLCLEALRRTPDAALVSGRPRYVRKGRFVHDGVLHEHAQARPAERVRSYLRAVADNGVFYGLMPRAVLEAVQPLPNVLGNDWLHVARIAARGPIRMLSDVRVHRELDGTSVDVASILSTFGGASWKARMPNLVIAWELLRDIGWEHPAYAQLGRRRRLALAIVGAVASIRWRALAWHLVTPTMVSLARRPRGRPLYRLYMAITRALGAGRQP